MFGASIGRAGQRIIDAMVRWLARGHINPNFLTFVGVAINVGSGLLFGFGKFFWAGIVLIIANLFDMLDGQVARLSGRVTSFGGFLDSSLDRLSDMVVFVGLMVFYARDTEFHSTLNVFLAGAGMMGSVMVSYASARAESLIPKCDVGFRNQTLCARARVADHHGAHHAGAGEKDIEGRMKLCVARIENHQTYEHHHVRQAIEGRIKKAAIARHPSRKSCDLAV